MSFTVEKKEFYSKFGLAKLAYKKMRQQNFVLEPTFDFHQRIRTYTETSLFTSKKLKKRGDLWEPLGQWEKCSLLVSSSALVLHLSIVLHFRSYKCDSCWWPKCEWDLLTIEPNCEKNYYFTWKNYPLGFCFSWNKVKQMQALGMHMDVFFFSKLCLCDYYSYLTHGNDPN